MSYRYDYPRPAVTVDVVLVRVGRRHRFDVLLIRRKHAPFKNRWALPGGFLDMDEELEDGARRELLEETKLEVGPLLELGTYGKVGRDPRGRTVGVVFLAFDAAGALEPTAGDDAASAGWFALGRPPQMAFDHEDILIDTRHRLRELGADPGRLLALLPRRVTMAQVHGLCQGAAGKTLDRAGLRRRLLRDGTLVAANGRKVPLYRVRKSR